MPGRSEAPSLVSLFSGCGGMDLGFVMAGFRPAFAVDTDPDARAVYRLNIGEIDGRDVREVPSREIPRGDVLAAGFPCQPFSTAGRREGVSDPRGTLYAECLRVAADTRPGAVVLENVRGLLSSRLPDGRGVADAILEDLAALGYAAEARLLNAADYGVPQNRRRVFIIGVRRGPGARPPFPEKAPGPPPRLGEAIAGARDAGGDADWPLSPQALAMARLIPEGGSWKDVPYEALPPRLRRIRDDMGRYRSPCFYRRFGRDEVAGTVTASAQPEKCGILHPTEDRRLSVRECARIQSFPDSFRFVTGSPRDVRAMYRLIGNAVPPELARRVAEALKGALGPPGGTG